MTMSATYRKDAASLAGKGAGNGLNVGILL